MRRRKDFGAFKMVLDPWLPGISKMLLQRGRREEAFMSLLERTVTPGMTVLDLGSNIGYTTMTMAAIVGAEGKVYAIEPDPRNLKLLRKNVALNKFEDRVEVTQCAVSDHVGRGEFLVARKSNLSGMDLTAHTKKSRTIDIELVTLDSFFENRDLPEFIKMDIEGHEVEALRGFLNTVKNKDFPLNVLMEVHPVMYSEEHSLAEVLRAYFDAGFKCPYVVSAAVAQPKPFADLGYEPAEVFDIAGQFTRGIYTDISEDHVMDLAGRLHDDTKVVRALLIQRAG